MAEERKEKAMSQKFKDVPVLKIKFMTDDEWNRLVYKQYLQSAGASNGRA